MSCGIGRGLSNSVAGCEQERIYVVLKAAATLLYPLGEPAQRSSHLLTGVGREERQRQCVLDNNTGTLNQPTLEPVLG